ncbi:unnamed protein product [Rhodiola kirilowii]
MGEIEGKSHIDDEDEEDYFDISVVSNVIKPTGYNRRFILNNNDIDVIHWCVMENYEEARDYIKEHAENFYNENPYGDNDSRIKHFHSHLLNKLHDEGSNAYSIELHILACKPQFHSCYTHCVVNGLKFVVWDKDQHLRAQNSGVMVQAGENNYYGVLQNIIELKYANGMPVVIFQCKWFDTDSSEGGNIKLEHGILMIDTSNTWYEDAPYCLAKHAHQVFYLEDPKFADNWKIVNVVAQRGTYSHSCVGTSENAFQEDVTLNIPPYNCNVLDEETLALYYDFNEVDEEEYEYEHEEGEDEFDEADDEEDDVEELHYVSDHEVSEEDEDEEGFDDDKDEEV